MVVEIYLLFHTEVSDCIADFPIANLFFNVLCTVLLSLVKITPKYTNDSTSSRTSPLRLILVLFPLFPHAITFVLSVLISSPTFSLEALTRSTSSCTFPYLEPFRHPCCRFRITLIRPMWSGKSISIMLILS